MRVVKLMGATLALRLLWGCSAKSENGNPGICKIKCSGAVIGSNDPQFKVVNLMKNLNFQCKKGLSEPVALNAVLLQFLFTESIKINGVERTRPVPNLAFEPLVTGILSDYKSEGNTNPATGEVPQRYVGIRTPKTEWCTDSCGVASIEIEPMCLTAGLTNEVQVGIHSGPLFSAEAIMLKISTPEAAN